MAKSLSPARVRAIADLQEIRDQRPVNSLEYASADHAIDLVMNETRPENAFLVPNALRDARSVLLRQRRREATRQAPVEEVDTADGFEAISPSALMCQSPEQALIWSEGYRKLAAWAAGRSVRTARCLEHWRYGNTAAEGAGLLNISRRTVMTERKTIRLAARNAGAN
ncbi:hypothetical protein [Caulobacter sp. 602-1]|uniref:hypothetical protein n=1 Tax=Caulobacter sp. 602-1 TaxID=2492472 RepID=UPI000F63225D|nr:hypothetical protein [Caulobacter sp. 602-1]RRN63487.1 hypothetical protein EIK80_16875 [Caulobacter sp. 602-1]